MGDTIIIPTDNATIITIDTTPLSADEEAAFAVYDAMLRRGWRDVGEALTQIRNRRLYRTRHASFEDYCVTTLGLSKPHATRLIQAAAVVATLEGVVPIGTTLPANEAQARPLAQLPPEAQPVAWERANALAAAQGEPLAARHVQAAVREQRGGGAEGDMGAADDRDLPAPLQPVAAALRAGDTTTAYAAARQGGITYLDQARAAIDALVDGAPLDVALTHLRTARAQRGGGAAAGASGLDDTPLTEAELIDLSRLGGWEQHTPKGRSGPERTSPKGLVLITMAEMRGERWGERVVERTPGGWRLELAALRRNEAQAERTRDLARRGIAVQTPDDQIPADWDHWQGRASRLRGRLALLIDGGVRLSLAGAQLTEVRTFAQACAVIRRHEQAAAASVAHAATPTPAADAAPPVAERLPYGAAGANRWLPIVPHVLILGERTAYYAPPPLTRAATIYDTPTTVRLRRADGSEETQAQHKIWCVADDHAWDAIEQAVAAFGAALATYAQTLRDLGRYAERLHDERESLRTLPTGPLCPSVARAEDPDHRHHSTWMLSHWMVPGLERTAISRHTAKMLEKADGGGYIFSQNDSFVVEDDAAWERISAAHQAAVAAAAGVEDLLNRLGTYQEAREDGRYQRPAAPPHPDYAQQIQAAPDDATLAALREQIILNQALTTTQRNALIGAIGWRRTQLSAPRSPAGQVGVVPDADTAWDDEADGEPDDLNTQTWAAITTILRRLPESAVRLLASALCFEETASVAFTAPITDIHAGFKLVASQGNFCEQDAAYQDAARAAIAAIMIADGGAS